MAPDGRGPEDAVAEDVVEVAVGIDDHAHRRVGQLAQVGLDLAGLRVGRSRIDDQGFGSSQHDPDVLVVERVATDEDLVADLDPATRRTHA